MGSNKHKNNTDKAESRKNPSSTGESTAGIIKDARFSSANWDPRFREAPKYKSKVKIDSRFTRLILKNRHFASSKAPIDKRGRPKRKHSAFESLNRYYRLEGEGAAAKQKNRKWSDSEIESVKEKTKDVGSEEESEKISENEGSESDDKELMKKKLKDFGSEEESKKISESEASERMDEELKKKKKVILRKESESESSDAESEEDMEDEEGSDDSSSSSTDTDDDEVYEKEEETFAQPEENIPEIDKETHRLAVVNMDWSHVKAVDLFMVLSSFLPKGGQIKSVAVYPSEFGLKRMEEEAVHGPVGLFDDDKRKSGDDEDEDEDDEIDHEKLRAYELSRLRYYFSVVECDSIATADYLYKSCDGVEFERSSIKLDLRFIPDSMEFKHPPRDVATEAPESYEGLDFHNRALQHSNIHLTWDDDEPHRTKTLKRKFSADQLAELELKEFLASDESGSDDTEDDNGMEDRAAKRQEKQKLYRALVQSGDGSDENEEDENQDMEVTFNTGLEDLSKRIIERKDTQSESVWEAYLRKRREKKAARKNRSKNSSEDDSSGNDTEAAEEPDDFFIDESYAKGSRETRVKSGKKDREQNQNSEASRAELELLLADDKGADSNLKGYNLKSKKKKGRAEKEIPDGGKLPAVDYDDPRFSALFASPLFALDPTDPQFKRSADYARQLAQKQQKGKKGTVGLRERPETNGQAAVSSKPTSSENSDLHGDVSKKEKHELSSLVRSLKMKAKQMAHHGKISEKGSKQKLNTKGSK